MLVLHRRQPTGSADSAISHRPLEAHVALEPQRRHAVLPDQRVPGEPGGVVAPVPSGSSRLTSCGSSNQSASPPSTAA